MSSMLVPGLIVSSNCTKRLRRELPIEGECFFSVGAQVSANDVVARAEIPGDLTVLKLAEKLSIDAAQVKRALVVKVGELVEQGQTLCLHRGLFGLFKSTYAAPHAGSVEFFSEQTGHLAVRSTSRMLEVSAHVDGKVVHIEQRKSVTIETQCAFVQGIFGVGGERRGKLFVLKSTGPVLDEGDIPDTSIAGVILVARHAPSVNFIRAAEKAGAIGLVVGSIDDRTLHAYLGYDIGIAMTGNEQIPMTVIITEGFGRLEMSERTFSLFSKQHGCHASINGATKVRAGAERPEIIIQNSGQPTSEILEAVLGLEVGVKVRIIRYPYFGVEGTVKELPSLPKQLDTGVLTRVATVGLNDGREIRVPRANLELV